MTSDHKFANDVAERLFQKLSASRRRPFAPSKGEDKAGDGLWEAYLDAVEDTDKASAESWNGSTTGILTFTGLFAATVAAFVIESYQMLQPNPSFQSELIGNQTLVLLAQLVSANGATSNIVTPTLQTVPFQAPYAAVVTNSLWFLDLAISLVCALLATLIQEWTRDFLRDIQRRTPGMTIKEYSFNHLFVRMGVERYKLDYVTSLIVALMHIAVLLFLVGLVMFLHQIHNTPAIVVEAFCILAAVIYTAFSVIPFWDNSCPYRTPLTYALITLGSLFLWVVFPMAYTLFVACGFAAWGLILFALFSPFLVIILCFLVLGSIWGRAHAWVSGLRLTILQWWQPVTELGILALYQDMPWTQLLRVVLSVGIVPLGILRGLVYTYMPTRRLPDRKEIPAHLWKYMVIFGVLKQDVEEKNRYIDHEQLLFLWKNTTEFFFGPQGSDTLFVHVINRLLNLESHHYGFFWHYSRHNPTFMRHFVQGMCSVESLDAGMGALKLLQLLIRGSEDVLDMWTDCQWTMMDRYNLRDHFVPFIHKVISFTRQGDSENKTNAVTLLSELRCTLILARSRLRSYLTEDEWDEQVQFLNTMLLSLEGIDGFSLVPIYLDSQGLSDEFLNAYEEEYMRVYELALQNTITLLANLIILDKDGQHRHDLLRSTIMQTWHELSAAKKFEAFVNASRKRQPSIELVSILYDTTHCYGDTMRELFDCFDIPPRSDITDQELEAGTQTLIDRHGLFQSSQQPIIPQATSRTACDNGAKHNMPSVQVVLSNDQLEKLGMRLILAPTHAQSIDGAISINSQVMASSPHSQHAPSPLALPVQIPESIDIDHGIAYGTGVSALSIVISTGPGHIIDPGNVIKGGVDATRIPSHPSIHNDCNNERPSARGDAVCVHAADAPDSPSLRSVVVEEGRPAFGHE